MNQDLTPKQQTSEAIRQAESILIITGQHPNIDQAASTMALAAVLRKYGKKVSAIITDPLPQQLSFLDARTIDTKLGGMRDFVLKVDLSRAEAESLRWERGDDAKLNIFVKPARGGFAPSDVTFGYGDYHYDLAIVLGVPTRARIDRVYAENQGLFDRLPIVNLDFHRSNENYGAINLIEPTASSLSEMLVALAESLQNGIVDADIATSMLAGLMASTDRFTAAHTTAKSLTVAAQLMAAGAKQPQIVRAIFRDSRAAQQQERREQESQPRNDTSSRNDSSRNDAPRNNDNQRNEQPRQQEVPRDEQSTSVSAPVVHQVQEELHPVVQQPIQIVETTPTAVATSEPVVLPLPVAPAEDPIIEPSHIEMMMQESADQIPMADFAAATRVLDDRNYDDSGAPRI